MLNQYDDYRSYLKSILAEKVSRNPSYSLRAFSRHVGLAPGFLSEVLSRKKKLSLEASIKIAEALELNSKDTEYFQILVQIDSVKTQELKLNLTKKLEGIYPHKRPENLSLDAFRTMSDWYHVAAVELTQLNRIELNVDSIEKLLGVQRLEASAALDRLERLEIIEKDKNGKYRKTIDNPLISSSAPNEALRNFHKQMLNKAIASLTTQGNHEKFVGSETMAFSPSDLPEITKAIEECFSKILTIASKSKNKTKVYHLGIQFFNLLSERKK